MHVTGPLCTRRSLAAELRAAGVEPGGTLLVHSSLSSLGWVSGGAVAVVQALLDVLGPTGTLAVPTHTGDNSDPAEWSNPPVPPEWWPDIRASWPGFDPRVSPSLGMGAVPETARTWPGALRSTHPQTSFAALGPGAVEITDGHALDCRLGEASPLARLEDRDAHVLLLGVDFGSCTCFHLAEYRVPGPSEECAFAAVTPEGRQRLTVEDRTIDAGDFTELGAAFEAERPEAVRHGTVGAAATRLFRLRDAVAYAQRWLPEHRPQGLPRT